MVSTDLASRGLDVKDVSTVINYDMPDSIESYINRIGRTGRAGRSGHSISFLTRDCTIAAELAKFLKSSKQPMPPELQNVRQFGKHTTRATPRGKEAKAYTGPLYSHHTDEEEFKG